MLDLGDMRSHSRFDLLKQVVNDAGSDSDGFFGGTHTGGYHVQQNPEEFSALLCFLLNRCRPIKRYCEIGVAAGGTTRLIFETVGIEHATLLDNGVHPKHQFFAENVALIKRRTFIGDSHSEDAKRFLAADELLPEFDVAFIDGDHSYEGVKQDIELVRPYCSPATLLIFHDTYICPGVKQMWAEIKYPVAEFVSEEKPFGIGVCRHG